MALNSFNKALINVYTDYGGKENGGGKKWKLAMQEQNCRNGRNLLRP